MTDVMLLTRLENYLTNAKFWHDENPLTVDEIKSRGISLTPGQVDALAQKLGVDSSEMPNLMDALVTKLENEAHENPFTHDLDEDASSADYTWEEDATGSITVRSAQTGDAKVLDVQDSAKLLDRLDHGNEPEQAVLRQIMNESEEGEGYSDIYRDRPIRLNFPWSIGDRHGSGVALCKGSGVTFDVKVESVKEDGKSIHPDADLMDKLSAIARDYVHDC